MDIIKKLPLEIENKIFYFVAEHPLATIFKKHIKVKYDETSNVLIIEIRDPPIVRESVIELTANEDESRELDRRIESYKLVFPNNYSRFIYIVYGIKDNGSDLDSDIYDFDDDLSVI